ncbi:MAG TPA: dihydrofolate reductase [Gammaproteobacteria bacterium]
MYIRRVWFSNGIHHHYSNEKFDPGFGFDAFARFVRNTPGEFPLREGQSLEAFLAELRPIMFDPGVDSKLVEKSPGIDVVAGSAVNFYVDLTQAEVGAFYAARQRPDEPRPISHGLNSRLVRTDEGIVEQIWRLGGLYSEAIEPVVGWLERAVDYAENPLQRDALQKLIHYYRTGDLADWDEYSIAWVRNTESRVDLINGFIEVYNDPLGMRGSFESVLSIRDPVATRRIDAIASEAQWFEDNSPIMEAHKKDDVTGITGKVINVVVESGDASPATPIGINLPNADWIRREHGSKSVNLANIVSAYDAVAGGAADEFSWDDAERQRTADYGVIASTLMTDMHEVIGHASGQLEAGVGTLHETLKNYGSTLEEARADLVALYYMMDPKLVELGVLPSIEAGHAGYDRYIRNGLMQQLNRVELGSDLEQDHMRNRQMVASWVLAMGDDDVIERRSRDGKTYFVINDYDALRALFGRLLRELQRIKSQGDFAAAQDLVEIYGVRIDPELHAEVLERYEALDIPPYSGFINPRLVPVTRSGEIIDVRIEYPDDFSDQMLGYADDYGFLPAWNL